MRRDVLAILTDATPDTLTDGSREALGLARKLANAFDGSVAAVLIGNSDGGAAEETATRSADRVFTLTADQNRPRGDLLLAGATEAATQLSAGIIVVSRGPHALEIAPRLAARLGGGCVMNVIAVDRAEGGMDVTAAIFGGAARAVYRMSGDRVAVLGASAGAAEAAPLGDGVKGNIQALTLADSAGPSVRIVRPARAPEGPRLEDAQVIVSGGRGLREAENFGLVRELAAALGGLPGASRAIVDDGWAEPSEQIGLTGKIVAPQLYVAVGISGASQHMAGCSNARTLVAINSDPEAPIFRYAQFGIVDDCLSVLPELIRIARQSRQDG